jgi:hypothetical protein
MSDSVPLHLVNYRITAESFDEQLDPDEEPSAFVTRLPFELRQGPRVVARVHALLVRVRVAERSGCSISELFDSVDQDLHGLYDAIYDQKTGEIREDLSDSVGNRNVLYVDTVKVVSNRRGQGLGLRMVECLRDIFAEGCAVVALKAYPLSLTHSKNKDKTDDEVFARPFAAGGEEAKAKLRAYWSRLGFKRVDQTDYMVFDMSDEPPLLKRD